MLVTTLVLVVGITLVMVVACDLVSVLTFESVLVLSLVSVSTPTLLIHIRDSNLGIETRDSRSWLRDNAARGLGVELGLRDIVGNRDDLGLRLNLGTGLGLRNLSARIGTIMV